MNTTQQHEEEDDRLAGDLLVGATAIRDFLVLLGLPDEIDEETVYYMKRAGWPIGNTGGKTKGNGGKLIASKRRIARHTQKLATLAS
jgi:hypothetical protein